MFTSIDIDDPLPPPTYRSLIPPTVFALREMEFESLQVLEELPFVVSSGCYHYRDHTKWRSTSAGYGQTLGVVLVHTRGPDKVRNDKGELVPSYNVFLAVVNNRPIVETFYDDPYYNLALVR